MTDRAVMLSVKPKYCELIASGKKTIEVRKTKPKIQTPFKCYIYCTKSKSHYATGHIGRSDDELHMLPNGQIKFSSSIELMLHNDYTAGTFLNGKVIGEFICDKTITVDCDSVAPFNKDTGEYIDKECCVDRDSFLRYANYRCCYGWHISELNIYDKPKKLGEFKKLNCDCWYAHLGLAKRDCSECQNKECFVEHPSQSWCYVQEVSNND